MRMTDRPPAQSLQTFLAAYDRALECLSHLGVRTSRGRLRSYRDCIARAVELEVPDSDGTTLPHQTNVQFLNALFEASEIIEIATLDQSLLTTHATLTKLRQLCRGPDFIDPTKDDPARNYGFEFATAALAAKNGRLWGFQAGDLEVGPPPCPVECKRVSSWKRLSSNILAARDQLAATGKAGLIALDISAPIRHERGIAIPCSSEDSQRLLVDQELIAYLFNHYSGPQQDILGNAAVLGLVFRNRVVGSVGAAHQIRSASTWHLIPLHEGTSLDASFRDATQFISAAPIVEGTAKDVEDARNAIVRVPTI